MWRTVDLVLRLLYVLFAPIVLAAFSAVVPIGSIVITTGIATTIALVGSDRWRRRVETLKWIGRPLGGFARLGDYYREHPPKPLVYYIAYPALFPYWLWSRNARREFLLYRKLSSVALVILVGVGFADYWTNWRPIPFGFFLSISIATFVLQLLITFAVVMPVVTTIITLHERKLRKTLAALLVGCALVTAFGIYSLHKKHPDAMGMVARTRARSAFERHRAFEVLHRGLDVAAAALAHGDGDDIAVARAREALEDLYRPDEAAAFRLYHDDRVIMLYAKFKRFDAIWLAAERDHPIIKPEGLTPGARAVIGL